MIDQVSPIIYKKLSFDKFENKRKNDIDSTLDSSKIFYDEVSERFIQFNEDNIKIFNKKITNLKKSITIKLQKDKITLASVDRNLRYLLVGLENKLIIIINLKTSKVTDMINYDLTIVKGVFFITRDSQIDDFKFCLVCNNKIEIFKINTNNSIGESSSPIKLVKIQGIHSFSYDSNFMILMIKKYDIKNNTSYFSFTSNSNTIFYKFEFYNLQDEKQYSKNSVYDYYCTRKDSNDTSNSFSKFFNYFYNSNTNNNGYENEIKNDNTKDNLIKQKSLTVYGKSSTTIKNKSDMLNNNIDKNNGNINNNNKKNLKLAFDPDNESNKSESQFYLVTIYFTLYLVCLNFEEKEIQINQIASLSNIIRVRNLALNVSASSNLQFVDNLIIYHDYDRYESIIIDLRSEISDQPLMIPFPISSKDILDENDKKKQEIIDLNIDIKQTGEIETKFKYNNYSPTSMLVFENKQIYSLISKIKGNIVENTINDEFYYVYFDPSVFYEYSPIEYQAIFHLIRRKDSKTAVVNGIFDLIKKKNSVKIIKLIFSRLVSDYKLLLKPELMLSNTLSILSTQQITNPIEMKNYGLILNRKKMILKQTDIAECLFKLFIYNDYQIDVIYILELLIQYISSIHKEGIQVHVMLISILISLLKKIKPQKQVITMFIQYHSIPDSFDLASFLIRDYFENDDIHSLGLDMMKKLHKNDIIVLELLKKRRISEALLFAKTHKVTLEYIPNEIKDIIKECLNDDNRKLLVDFLSC